METLDYNLTALVEAKNSIKDAIKSKGVTPEGGLVTYADAISRINVSGGPAIQGKQGIPEIIKSEVNNHSVSISTKVSNTEGYIPGGTITGESTVVSASDLVDGNYNVSINTETDITNYKTVTTSVPPCIYATDAIVTNDGDRTLQFLLPAKPRAWFLGLGQSTLNATWNSKYRCVGAQYDGSKIVWHTAYKGNQGSANPYIYRVVNTGASQSWDEENKILTINATTAGSQTYAGPFMQRQYNLYAVLDNFGTEEILINMIRSEQADITDEDLEIINDMLNK